MPWESLKKEMEFLSDTRDLCREMMISNLKDEELSGSSPSVFLLYIGYQLDDWRGRSHKLPLEGESRTPGIKKT